MGRVVPVRVLRGGMVQVWFALARLNADLAAEARRSVGLGWTGAVRPGAGEPRRRHPDLDALGLDRMPSSGAELRRAYRAAARAAHPDAPGGSEEAFLAVSGAFERLAGALGKRTA